MNEDAHPEQDIQNNSTRRTFLKGAIGVLAALNALIVGLPFIGSLLPSAAKRKVVWSKVGDLSSISEGQPVEMKFAATSEDAYHHANLLYSVWIIKEANGINIFSPICTHLGCHFKWNPQTGHFECPCHGSVFSVDGKVLGGPAPRPLDTMPFKVEGQTLYVRYERFRSGTPEKIEV